MESLTDLPFNPKPPAIMHIDLNSCFATIEQQANPLLRGKPVAVAAYVSPGGCIVAPSVEAKRLGIKTGMRVKDGRLLCRDLVVVAPDPNKYRAVHLGLRRVLGTYTDKITPKSIDEFVLDLEGSPSYCKGMLEIGREIKRRIKQEIGEYLTVSVGIAPNRFLAKTAAGLRKPDGLEIIDVGNYLPIFMSLKLIDLCGIKVNNLMRLNNMGIHTVTDFLTADSQTLKAAFRSVVGYYWYLRLRGFEADDVVFDRKSYGNSYALPWPFATLEELSPIVQKLVEKMGARMRRGGYRARGVHLAMLYKDWSHWHKGEVQSSLMFDSRDIYKACMGLLLKCPYRKPVHTLAVSCFDLVSGAGLQMTLLEDLDRKDRLVAAVDRVNERWGWFVITPARMLGTAGYVPDRVAFGGVKELEEIMSSEVEVN